MSNSEKDDPLLEWNRLNKDNAEQSFVSAMYLSISETTSKIDSFSIWLLAGTGATSALLITQIGSILPYLSERGFKLSLTFLVLSAISAFIAKYKALRCEIQLHLQKELAARLDPIFSKHDEDEKQIQEYAQQRGIVLQTEIEMSKVIEEFSRPFPKWVRWLIKRQISKTGEDRQAGYHIAVVAYMSQLRWSFIQAIAFMAFILTSGWYASAL